MKLVDQLNLEQKRELFARDKRLEVVLFALATALTETEHQWTNEQRAGFDWAARNLHNDLEKLAA